MLEEAGAGLQDDDAVSFSASVIEGEGSLTSVIGTAVAAQSAVVLLC